MNLKTIGIVVTVVVMQACGTTKNSVSGNQTMWVSGCKTECDAGAGKGECLLVTTDADLAQAKWENFYTNIEGFTFEPGVMQKIDVKVVELSGTAVAADRSSLKYVLLKVIEKKKDNRWELQGDWTLNRIAGSNSKYTEEVPYLHIDLTKRQVSGSNGCNNFSGMIQNVNASTIALSRMITTLRACMDMPISDEFSDAFKHIHSYNINNNTLTFSDESNKELMSFTKKVNSTADTRIHDIYVAVKIKGEEIGKREEMPRFEINLNTMKVFGNNGCNEFNGTITSVTEKKITFSGMAMTRKMCQDMVIPGKFDNALQATASYKFEDLHLTLFDKEGKELITFLKVD